ncbi:MAG: hypothetical protein JO323_07710 [Acidobacteriia bacterium]|nr:hypothetical protein [Terriglobia bacterium]
MKNVLMACTFLFGMWASNSAFAHHSMAGFDRNKTVTLVGTVKYFKWANPHSWIEMEVPNSKGGVEVWDIEMTSPAVLIRAGWKSTFLKPGDKVTVAAHPLQTGDPGGTFVSVILPDGRTMTDRPPQSAGSKQ